MPRRAGTTFSIQKTYTWMPSWNTPLKQGASLADVLADPAGETYWFRCATTPRGPASAPHLRSQQSFVAASDHSPSSSPPCTSRCSGKHLYLKVVDPVTSASRDLVQDGATVFGGRWYETSYDVTASGPGMTNCPTVDGGVFCPMAVRAVRRARSWRLAFDARAHGCCSAS